MSEMLKEIGKGLIALANLMMVVLFFKHYQESGDMLSFYKGVIFGFGLYLLGGIFILIGKDVKKQ
jgi:hypothetical protein